MKINLKGFMVRPELNLPTYGSFDPQFTAQVGNGCVGNEVGGCGRQTGMKIHIDFYHGHALFPDVRLCHGVACCRGSDNYYFFDVQEIYDAIIKECGDFMKLRFVLL